MRKIDKLTKGIEVACAIIEKDGHVFAAQRSPSMNLAYKWEFPGGKIEEGEQPEECLEREILEELKISINVLTPQPPSTYHYPAITVTLFPFICSIASGSIQLQEHMKMVWLPPEKLFTLDWAEADLPVLAHYCEKLEQRKGK